MQELPRLCKNSALWTSGACGWLAPRPEVGADGKPDWCILVEDHFAFCMGLGEGVGVGAANDFLFVKSLLRVGAG